MNMSFSLWTGLIQIMNIIIVIGIVIFVPYMLFSINRKLGRLVKLLEKRIEDDGNQ